MRTIKISPVARAIGTFGAVAALVTGVTFAALSNSATLSANTVSSVTADLTVSTDNSIFGDNEPGLTVTGLIPGTGVNESVWLRNQGDATLAITAHVPALPGAPVGGYGFSGFENLTIAITTTSCGDTVLTNILALNAGDVALPCAPQGINGPSGSQFYNFHFDIVPASLTPGASHAGVGVFDLVFTGNTP